MRDLGLDSLDQVEIIMAMEDEFGECFLSTTMFVSEFKKVVRTKLILLVGTSVWSDKSWTGMTVFVWRDKIAIKVSGLSQQKFMLMA